MEQQPRGDSAQGFSIAELVLANSLDHFYDVNLDPNDQNGTFQLKPDKKPGEWESRIKTIRDTYDMSDPELYHSLDRVALLARRPAPATPNTPQTPRREAGFPVRYDLNPATACEFSVEPTKRDIRGNFTVAAIENFLSNHAAEMNKSAPENSRFYKKIARGAGMVATRISSYFGFTAR